MKLYYPPLFIMLSEFRKQKVKKNFTFLDANLNGFIDNEDFDAICERFRSEFGWELNGDADKFFRTQYYALWQNLMSQSDLNQDGKISIEEFLATYEVAIADDTSFEKYVLPFFEGMYPILDSDGDGNVKLEDYQCFYRCHDNTQEQATLAFHKMDLNKDGILTREEVLECFRAFYMSEDVNHPGTIFYGEL